MLFLFTPKCYVNLIYHIPECELSSHSECELSSHSLREFSSHNSVHIIYLDVTRKSIGEISKSENKITHTNYNIGKI